jgi:two-component system phosphate regulon sensor histidine kinase PhoR
MSSNKHDTGREELERQNKSLRRQLSSLQQKLDEVDRQRVQYLQNVSHQLVAPLNAIKWHIENLTSARVSVDRAKKVMRSMYSQATIAVHLAKNFALMSNLEADHALTQLKEPLQEVELCGLLINLADDFQPLGWDKEIQIKVYPSILESAPPVLAMKPLISQVFSNIIENAVKYSNPGSEIRIDGNYDSDSVTVRIINSGLGLDRTETTRVFERGYRSEGAKNQYPAGTGFGLYIAKRIVEIHEGSIKASMELGNRTVFTVTLSVSGLKGKARQREAKNRSVNR